jgi:RNA polymerase sigma-70 factor (ECF subfamily)
LLLIEYRDVLFAYILTLVREWDMAEDVFQEVSVTILKKANEEEIGNFKAWAREIARRTALDYRRRRGVPYKNLSGDALEALESIFGARDEVPDEKQREMLAYLQDCLKDLPAKMLTLVNLRYQEDLTIEQVAERAELSPGAAQVALSRARAALAECIKRKSAQSGHDGLATGGLQS